MILADRLKRLEQAGIVVKTTYCSEPKRNQYESTEKGRGLIPVLEAVGVWAGKHVPGARVFPCYQRQEEVDRQQ